MLNRRVIVPFVICILITIIILSIVLIRRSVEKELDRKFRVFFPAFVRYFLGMSIEEMNRELKNIHSQEELEEFFARKGLTPVSNGSGPHEK